MLLRYKWNSEALNNISVMLLLTSIASSCTQAMANKPVITEFWRYRPKLL